MFKYLQDIKDYFHGFKKPQKYKSSYYYMGDLVKYLKKDIATNYKHLATYPLIDFYILDKFGKHIACIIFDFIGFEMFDRCVDEQ